jgi:hypothetical protein
MGEGGVKNYQKLRDVIFGRPLTLDFVVEEVLEKPIKVFVIAFPTVKPGVNAIE